MSYWKEIAIAIAIPEAVGYIGSLKSRETMKTWYKNIQKPSFTPPNWVFGPMWTLLYAGMGYASFLVWREGGGFSGAASTALKAYGVNLVFNGLWSPLFFGARRIDLVSLMPGYRHDPSELKLKSL